MRTALGREVGGTPHSQDGDAEDRPRRDTGARRLLGRRTCRTRLGQGAHAPGFGADKPAAVTAQRDSLIAECSAWAGPAGDWALADRGRAFANNATRLGKAVLGGVSLTVKPVTLAGTSGKVPVIITNEAETPLTLRVTTVPSREVELAGKRSSVMEVMPKDNFIEVPVELRDSLSGRLTVTVSAGGLRARERLGDGARLVSRPTGDDSWRRAGAWSTARVYHQTCARRRDCGHEYVRRRATRAHGTKVVSRSWYARRS